MLIDFSGSPVLASYNQRIQGIFLKIIGETF